MRICADDFGLNNEVSEGILNLARAGKINSVSCLVTAEAWLANYSKLKPFFKQAEMGLHLSLTYPRPRRFPAGSLSSLIKKSYLGQLDQEEIAGEIREQLEIFKNSLGRLPDYVDGHEFCHHFPVIRAALARIAEEFNFKGRNIYIRVFRPPENLSFLKNRAMGLVSRLASLPSKKLARILKEKGIAHNDRLLGFHPFACAPKKYFEYYFKARPSEKDIFFCHPGLLSQDKSDSLREYRPQIYNFMMSPEFDNMMKRHSISLSHRRIASG